VIVIFFSEVTLDIESSWPIFICYRQSDGMEAAEWIYKVLENQEISLRSGKNARDHNPRLNVYFDQAASVVDDWTTVHEPYLKLSRAFILICTPGAKIYEGVNDWVHKEINWWLTNRNESPIIVDPLDEGLRYIPDVLLDKWPNAQRVTLRLDDWQSLSKEISHDYVVQKRNQLIGGIIPSSYNVLREELELKKKNAAELAQAVQRSRIWFTSVLVYLLMQNQKLERSSLRLKGVYLAVADTEKPFRSSKEWFVIATDYKLSLGTLRRLDNQNDDFQEKSHVAGTGFLVKGDSLNRVYTGETLFITATHNLINDPLKNLLIDDAITEAEDINLNLFGADFPGVTNSQIVRFDKVVYTSPVPNLDITVLKLRGSEPTHTAAVDLSDRDQKIEDIEGVVGLYWQGSLGFTLGLGHGVGESVKSEFDGSKLLYTYMTAPGASGAPVFSADSGKLLCVHQQRIRSERDLGSCTFIDQIIDDVAQQLVGQALK